MKRIRINEDQAELRYASPVKIAIDLIKPKNLYLVAGRGTAKTSDVLAERIIDICYDMPRASFALVANTYVNLLTNIIPVITTAWRERKKWVEFDSKSRYGHYVKGEAPPPFWDKPFTDTFSYKHTITTFLGNKFFLVSLDRADISAGISVVHHFVDEAKYTDPKMINKLFPTLRGDAIQFGRSPYFLGQTVVTDMPNAYEGGQFDWILEMEKKMNRQQIKTILDVAFIVNDIRLELVNATTHNASPDAISKINLKLDRWINRYNKIRRDSTFFYIISSFANADVLTVDYFKNLYETLPFEEFKVAVLSIRATVAKEARFYPNLKDHHFYADGYNYNYYDSLGLSDNITQTSAGLKYIQHDKPLDAGFDGGNMMSLVIGQEQGRTYRVLKNIHTLPPEWIRELADEFVRFFAPHQYKYLHLYHDRAANNFRRSKQDWASKLKEAIERTAEGKPTGWTVKLESVGQANISHAEEYDLMIELMAERNKLLPLLQIDAHECRELASSLRRAPVTKNSKGEIQKVKKSEKLAAHRLPMESTNYSDAFKYLMCRRKYLAAIRNRKPMNLGDAGVV